MAVYNSMLNIMPYHCRYCIQGWYAMKHISAEAVKQGLLLTELEKEQAEKQLIWDTLAIEDPIFVNGFGHGNNNVYTGDTEMPIFTSIECDILAGRIVYLLSCLTANGLGPAIIGAGGIAYGGYNIAWTWGAANINADPYTDFYAEGYYRATNEFPIALIQGETVARARDRCIAEYNRWIEIWETERADDSSAAGIIKFLIHDRDGLTVLGYLEATIFTEPPEKVMLSIDSEPIPAPITLDGVPITLPWTGEVSGGVHVIETPWIFQKDSIYYAFRYWENGSTKFRRAIWLDKDTNVKATFEETVAHNITVASEPSEIEFAFNGERYTTPYSELREDRVYTVKFPFRFQRNGTWYGFDHWEDGSTNPERTITLASDMNLTAHYKVLPIHKLTFDTLYDSTPFITMVKIDDVRYKTPITLDLPEGLHVLIAYPGICQMPGLSFGFKNWQDGSTEPRREINLTADTAFLAYYMLTGGYIPVNAKDMLTGEDLNVSFLFHEREWTTPVTLTCVLFGTQTLPMPAEHEGYVFDHWQDGSTDPVKTFYFDQEKLELTAYYRAGPAHTLRVNSQPVAGAIVKVDGEPRGETPATITLIEGPHAVEVPTEFET